ncbi:MAG TPA: DUF1800 domain-containing protein [Gemmataceae bacterium]|jgi:uncharacterized protein (DUF1800 family)|nr:DUF1800 domain-containing protein [Gemmataceae bacterium]
MAEQIDPRWAWERYRPTKESPWDLKKVGHLYRRASFGATWAELETALKEGPDKSIDRLFQAGSAQKSLDEQTAALARTIARSNNDQQARAWWLYRMLYSGQPLREKLTLFWHNHFATQSSKVQKAGFMLGQYELMHRHALGSFRTLLQEMSKDPAMMVMLDTSLSRKDKPNENYARELMELFSLGIGHYTEKDVREAARAFTGWKIQDGKAVFVPAEHDDGDKTVLGRTGKWNGSDIVRICLEQKSAPSFIVRKLFRFLVSEAVDATPGLLEPLAAQFRKSDYNFGALVDTVLRSNLFFSPQAYRTRIKPPVDFALGIVRALEGRLGTTALATALEELGQNLFNPPSVKGWDGGPAWLNGQTLLFRQNLALALTSTEDPRFGRRTDPAALARKHGKKSDADVADFFLKLFLQGDVPEESRSKLVQYQDQTRKQPVPIYWTERDAADHRVRALCHLVLTLPEFQLA